MDWKSLFVFDWRVVLSLAAIAVAAAYIRYKILFNHWKRRGIPEVPLKPVPFFGHAASLILASRSFTEFFHYMYKSAAGEPFVGYFHGAQPSIMIRDPELLKHIFVKDFHAFVDRGFSLDEDIDPLNAKGLFSLKGQRWKEMRARLSPTFSSGRMKAMFPIMQACTEQLYKSFSKSIQKSGGEAIVEVKECMACYSTDVIATCAFGIHCDSLENPQTNEFRRMGKLVFDITLKRRITTMLFFISPKLMKWSGLKFTDDETSTFFSNFVKDMVKQREKAIEQSEKNGKTEKKYEDFIHHLVLLKKSGFHFKDENDEGEQDENDILGQNKLSDKPAEQASWSSLDNEDLTAQVMLFFSAGFETTSATLSFALFELSASENGMVIQEKLRAEVDRVVAEDGGKLTYAGLQRMLLLDRVIKETLRIYPPAGVLGRKAEEDYKVPGTNLIIDAGTQLFIPIYSMQLDEKYFPNPTVFDPDRFLPENKENIQNFSYLPFGDGPRICIGERFALMQVKLGLATLLSKFKFEVCREKTDVPLRFQKTAFLMTTEHGIWLKVRPRHIFVKDFHAFVDRGFSVDEDIDPLNAKGLFSLKGQRWKEMRARLSPTFTSGRMKAMFPIMQACAEQLYKSFSKSIQKSGGEAIVEVKECMACYSTDVIATCAFGIHCDSLENPQTNEFRRMGKLVFDVTLKRRLTAMLFFLSPKLMKWSGLKFTDDETSTFFSNFVKDMVKQREKAIEQSEKSGKTEKKYEDFIHHLVMLKKSGFHFKDENDEGEQDESDILGQNKLSDKPAEQASWSSLDNEDLTAQAMLFFSAGFETTSATLSFALFELSASENGMVIQEKLRAEVDRVVAEDGGKLTYAGLQRMLLLDRVIKEALRMYPPAGVLGRKAEQDYKVPGTNLVIDAGTQLFIPIYSMQLDEKYFPNPTVFDPDRFFPENKENIQHFSYLPFGDGPRICIGERFALMQVKLGLATLLSKFKFEVCREKTDVPLRFQKTAFLLTTEQGIWLKVRPR